MFSSHSMMTQEADSDTQGSMRVCHVPSSAVSGEGST